MARAEARCINGTVLYTHTVPVETVAADGTRQLFSIPSSVFDDHSTILLRLTLDGADGECSIDSYREIQKQTCTALGSFIMFAVSFPFSFSMEIERFDIARERAQVDIAIGNAGL